MIDPVKDVRQMRGNIVDSPLRTLPLELHAVVIVYKYVLVGVSRMDILVKDEGHFYRSQYLHCHMC
jgi:hypothetical protein